MHLDDETLALMALGDLEPDRHSERSPGGAARSAPETSPSCARTVDYGKSSRDVELLEPPESVWTAISSELGLASSSIPGLTPVESTSDVVTPLRTRTPRRWWALTAAALVVGLFVGVAALRLVAASADRRGSRSDAGSPA